MCYNSTSPFLFLQTYSCLIIGYIQKRVTLSSKRLTVSLKKVDLFAQKGLPFLYSRYLLCQLQQSPKKLLLKWYFVF